jgi:hypothetical protein
VSGNIENYISCGGKQQKIYYLACWHGTQAQLMTTLPTATPTSVNDFHLLVDHLHHAPDSRHPVKNAPDIRLGKSRPRRKPRTKVTRQHEVHRQRCKSTRRSLIRSAYNGNMEDVTKLLNAAKLKQQNIVRKATGRRKRHYGVHRNSTNLELKQNAKRLQRGTLNIDATDSRGIAALSWAARRGHCEMVQTLLTNGAHVSRADMHSGKIPLHHASAEGHLDVVRTLLDHDSPLDPSDKRGNTPLILAAQSGHDQVVFALLLAGASWDSCNHQQSDAMLIARRLGHQQVIHVIDDHLSSIGLHYSTPSLLGPTCHQMAEDELQNALHASLTLQEELEQQTYTAEHQHSRAAGEGSSSSSSSSSSSLHVHHRKRTASEILHHQERNKHHLTRQEKQQTVQHMRNMSHRQHRRPTGFARDQQAGLSALQRVRWNADPRNRGEKLEFEFKRSLAQEWETLWGKLPGETNAERFERLGERQQKIPGQCPHLSRGMVCYSVRELGVCEYLHIPERPHIPLRMKY